jgi:anaerobic ribonucleoside-triphosphate reductase activating protein
MLNGKEMNLNELMEVISDSPWNVTFSGGDPFYQAEGFAKLAARIKKESTKTICCYTGFTIEELLQENDPHRKELLRNIDVLVDGPFIQAQRDEQLRFRGSANQRILEMKDFLPDE